MKSLAEFNRKERRNMGMERAKTGGQGREWETKKQAGKASGSEKEGKVIYTHAQIETHTHT